MSNYHTNLTASEEVTDIGFIVIWIVFRVISFAECHTTGSVTRIEVRIQFIVFTSTVCPSVKAEAIEHSSHN
jgi:hypothetical protein